MKMITHLGAAAITVLALTACERKNENPASETNTTSGTATPRNNDTPDNAHPATPGVATTTSGELDRDRKDGGSMGGSDTSTTRTNDALKDGGHGVAGDKDLKGKTGGDKNTSTTLGSGESGQYTGGKGTYGGKATQGTGSKGHDAGVMETR